MKANPCNQCYRCQGYGHFVNQCLSQARTLLVEVPIEEDKEDGLEVVVHQHDDTRTLLLKIMSSVAALRFWQ